LIIFFSILRQIFDEQNCSAALCLKNSKAAPGISHSQGSEIISQTESQKQSFDPVSYIGKPLNDTQRKQFLVLNGHQKKDNIHFPLQTVEDIK
jgi:hypothetical protein